MSWDWLWWVPVAPALLLLAVGPIAIWIDNRAFDRELEEGRARSRHIQREAEEYKRLKDERDRLREAGMPLIYCKVCHKTHSVRIDEKPCAPDAWVGEDSWEQHDLTERDLVTGRLTVPGRQFPPE